LLHAAIVAPAENAVAMDEHGTYGDAALRQPAFRFLNGREQKRIHSRNSAST